MASLFLYWTYCGHATYGFISIYIFYARGCAFMVLLCEYFIMLWNANAYVMYYYTVCVFLDMIMHYVMVVCFLYVFVDVPI